VGQEAARQLLPVLQVRIICNQEKQVQGNMMALHEAWHKPDTDMIVGSSEW
jgi:hypothetical protein